MNARRLAALLLPSVMRRYRVTLAIGALGSALMLVLLALVASGADAAGSRLDGLASQSLRTVEVDSYSPRGDAKPITASALANMRMLPHVQSATGWAQQGMTLIGPKGAAGGTDPVQVWATPVIPAVQPRFLQGSAPRAPRQLAIPRAAARTLELTPGSETGIEFTRKQSSSSGVGVDQMWRVTGVYDDSVVGIDGPEAVYVSSDQATALVAAANGQTVKWASTDYAYPKAYLVASSLAAVPKVQTQLSRSGFAATGLAARATALPRLAQLLIGLQVIVVLLLLLFLLVSGWIVASSLVAARRSEIGLLRGLGWARGGVARMFDLQMAAMGLLVGLVGSALGLGGCVVVTLIAGGTTVLGIQLGVGVQLPSPAWLLAAVVTPVIVYALAGAAPVARATRRPPDEVLRDL